MVEIPRVLTHVERAKGYVQGALISDDDDSKPLLTVKQNHHPQTPNCYRRKAVPRLLADSARMAAILQYGVF
ncbi:hypothetical protein OAN307_c08010 [Octadecabacter antarcticus 307]|uniref:Uncharacterized protein n=1 Tax=Octadecabacter antarcticus 307 TaxID=391626 RepID=M9R872_9RHOB|nr:hypothetical protein OAN307_c08010 [Octadecabacter antarcticus 307]